MMRPGVSCCLPLARFPAKAAVTESLALGVGSKQSLAIIVSGAPEMRQACLTQPIWMCCFGMAEAIRWMIAHAEGIKTLTQFK